jgi:hypothetical protein
MAKPKGKGKKNEDPEDDSFDKETPDSNKLLWYTGPKARDTFTFYEESGIIPEEVFKGKAAGSPSGSDLEQVKTLRDSKTEPFDSFESPESNPSLDLPPFYENYDFRTLQDLGKLTPTRSEARYKKMRSDGKLIISFADIDFLKELANIIWPLSPLG